MAINKNGIHFALLCFSLVAVSTCSSSRRRGALPVGVYWGQSGSEGTLLDACATANYQIVNIGYLYSYGSGRTPLLDIGDHCDPMNGGCVQLSKEITTCQKLGVKVFLSIQGGTNTYSINSTDDSVNVAKYLWDNYFGGRSNSRPLGDALLDGVDFAIADGLSSKNWDTLARELWKYSEQGKKIYLSAAPQCMFPDLNLQEALNTGLFDYVWVQFFNNPSCEYSNDGEGFWGSWKNWMTINASKVFVGLPAASEAATSGYIRGRVLRTRVLPKLEGSLKFGGVMLKTREFDKGYSLAINPEVCESTMIVSSASDMAAMLPMGGNNGGGARGFRTCRGTCVIDYSIE